MSGIHGSGIATQTAANMLRKYAALSDKIGCAPEQVDHIRFVISQMERDFMELRAQRDKARDLACALEGKLHAQKIQETKNA